MENSKTNSIKVSEFLWEEEKKSMQEKGYHVESTKEFIEVVDPLIKSGNLSYDNLRDTITNKLMQLFSSDKYEDTLESRKQLVNDLYLQLTEYYKQYKK